MFDRKLGVYNLFFDGSFKVGGFENGGYRVYLARGVGDVLNEFGFDYSLVLFDKSGVLIGEGLLEEEEKRRVCLVDGVVGLEEVLEIGGKNI